LRLAPSFQPTYSDKILKEVPTYKMISQSVLIERMKINGSLARKAMRTLEDMGLIKKVVHHHGQWVYSAYSMMLNTERKVGDSR
jgi:small subunit ribosomal protein S25e